MIWIAGGLAVACLVAYAALVAAFWPRRRKVALPPIDHQPLPYWHNS